jgi:NADPH2:quinone reductase
MRAARCVTYGRPEQLVVEEVADPQPAEGEVLVDVHAAAVNFPDLLFIANRYQVSIPLPFTPGSEFAGVVASVGEGVTGVAPGDRVYGETGGADAFAERVTVPERMLTVLPDVVDLREAAAYSVTHATAYHALRSIADLRSGEWVLVLGAAGGVGLAAVQLAKVLGGRVVAAASSASKLELCRGQGADDVVNYSTEDLKERVKQITDGGADVVIDPVGGSYSEPALRATRWGGRFVVVGFATGEIPRIPLNLVLLKGVIVRGFEPRSFSEHAPDVFASHRKDLDLLFVTGKVHPYVSEVYPLDETARALRALADRTATGKILIDPRA